MRVWVDDVEGLIALSRGADAVDFHPWNATVADIDTADHIVLDLDPGEASTSRRTIRHRSRGRCCARK